MKYHDKENREFEIEAEQVEYDTTVKTAYGPALITQGNYIVTMPDGNKVGMVEADLKAKFRKVRADVQEKAKK